MSKYYYIHTNAFYSLDLWSVPYLCQKPLQIQISIKKKMVQLIERPTLERDLQKRGTLEYTRAEEDENVIRRRMKSMCMCMWKDGHLNFRNQYDNDVTTWSPQGRLHQLEYAMEAVKQGSAAVGIKSKTHAVLVSLKRAPSELSAYQKKTFEIDEHIGITIAGLTADARTLSRFMQTECMNHKYSYDVPLPVSRLVTHVGNRLQRSTIGYGRRPFGVGILCAGYDARGPHIYQIEPSSNFFDCKAQAIGARSQSARTYLERHLKDFGDSDVPTLIQHSLRALRDCLPADVELNDKNTCLSIVGEGQKFTTYDGPAVQEYLNLIDNEVEPAPEAANDVAMEE